MVYVAQGLVAGWQNNEAPAIAIAIVYRCGTSRSIKDLTAHLTIYSESYERPTVDKA
jgi:hypothetical protein